MKNKLKTLLLGMSLLLRLATAGADGNIVGKIGDSFNVTPMGQASYEIPIPALPGTGGMAPHLSVSYCSSSKSGLLGYGFDLTGLSIIGRTPRNLMLDSIAGEVDFTANDRFALDGQRLVLSQTVSGSERVYYTEVKNYARVTAYGPEGDPTSFKVETKDGITYEYHANTRILQAGSTVPGLFWMLTRATDTNGNYFSVSYQGNNAYNEIYPTRIDYTGNATAGLQPYASVRLSYENRPDTAFTYLHGQIIRHLKCVSTIGLYYGESKMREYRMGYTINNYHKLLTSVTEVASDNSEMPPTTFQWHTPGNLTVSGMDIQNVSNLNKVTLHIGDFNGDGKDDFVALPADGSAPYNGWQLFTSNGSNFTNAANGQLENSNLPKQVAVADFNGDGRADMAIASRLNNTYDMVRIYLSTGSGFSQSHLVGTYNRSFHILPIELNGDGARDLLITFDGDEEYRTYESQIFDFFSMTSGTSYFSSEEWGTPLTVDINGDGLTDVINMRDSDSRLLVANGQGTFSESSFGYNTSKELFYGDFNADGKDDMLYCVHNGVPISSGWFLHASDGQGGLRFICYVAQPFNPLNVVTHVADVNCDGYADLITINKTGGGQPRVYLNDCMGHFYQQPVGSSPYGTNNWNYYFGDFNGDGKTEFVCTADYENATWVGYELFLLPDGAGQLLASITDGLGNTTEIGYSYMSNPSVHTRGTAYNKNINSFASSWPVVHQVKTPDGIGGQQTLTYQYEDALMHHRGRGVLGFSKISTTDNATGIVTVTEYAPSESRLVMSPVHTETKYGGIVLSETDIEYGYTYPGTGSFSHLPQTITERTYEYNSGQLLTEVETVNQYDAYGNLTYSRVNNGDLTVTTENTYSNNETVWRLGRLTASEVRKTKTGGSAVHHAQFEYDSTTGLLTAEVSEPGNSSLGYRKTYVHDAFGNITSSTTAPLNTTFAPRTESTSYDAKGRFIKTVTNSLGHTVTNSVNDSNGLLVWSRDANNITTCYTYDSFGRCKKDSTPVSTTNTALSWSAGHADAPATALYHTLTQTTGKPYVLVFSDCLGRTVRTVTETAFGQKVYTDVVYNAKGQVWKTSEPYFPGSTPLWNVTTYDAVGRIKKQTDAAGNETSFTYNGYTTTTTDALGHSTVKTIDRYGNLVQSADNEGNYVSYQYDVEGHCTRVEGPRTVATMSYNLRGNRTQLNDPDLGNVTSVYNAYGELVSQTDSKGTTTYAYDLLGRITTETRPDMTVTSAYDTGFIGALASLTASNGTRIQNTYDAYGRITKQIRTVGTKNFTTQFRYDRLNRDSLIIYPSSLRVRHGYSSNGLLVSLHNVLHNALIWQLDSMDARGHATRVTLGNGLHTSTAYEAARGFLTGIQTDTIQQWQYAYNAVGALTQRKDIRRNLRENFEYDGLDRLFRVTRNGIETQRTTYDTAGNITAKTGVGHGFTYADGTNRLLSFYAESSRTKHWDNIQYTSFHKISCISEDGTQLLLTYGPEKTRVKTELRGDSLMETRYYAGNLYEEVQSGSVVRRLSYVFAYGRAVAVEERLASGGAVFSYFHHDHLGSIQAVTDENGHLAQEFSYDAWGRRRNPATWEYYSHTIVFRNPWGFTGHEHLDIFEMVNMDGRMYDPVTGRFLSPDPYIQAPDFTQGLNRYSYCLNNPLSLTDPSGYNWFSDNWKSLVASAVGITVSALTMGAATPAAIILAGAAGGAAGALTGALLNGANIGQIAKSTFTGAVIGGFSAMLNGAAGDGKFIERLLKHTFSQGWLEGIQGGNVLHGMMMGAVSSAGNHYIYANGKTLGRFGMITASAILGGTVDELGGGKFANGAITGAFSMMFNDMKHPKNMTEYRQALKKEIEKDGKLTIFESMEWWAIGNGETLEIEVNSLDLDFIDVTGMKPGHVWSQSLEPGGKHQWGVFGNVTIGYLGNNEIVVFPDYYDFDIKPNPNNNPDISRRNWWTKIDKAIHGDGIPFHIVFKGKYKLK